MNPLEGLRFLVLLYSSWADYELCKRLVVAKVTL
jgi:hypothetical protein